jgi:hypothetical protein|tara:strand:+ start:691 stop:957 length:267 start_codon:yes stop_codon:yes gene_type:complete
MKKKVTVTLTRVYMKEVEIEINNDLIKGMTDEEIATFLMEEYSFEEEDELFDKAELEMVSHDEDSLATVDTDRFDIYEDDKQVYGGHL